MKKLWDILRKFTHKTRVTRNLPVLLHNNEIVDEPTAVANLFGQHFRDLSSRANYTEAFLDHEHQISVELPDFGSANNEDYNKIFTLKELRGAIKRSGSKISSIGPDRIHYDFFRHMNETQLKDILDLYLQLFMA